MLHTNISPDSFLLEGSNYGQIQELCHGNYLELLQLKNKIKILSHKFFSCTTLSTRVSRAHPDKNSDISGYF